MGNKFFSGWRIRTTSEFRHVYFMNQRLIGCYYLLYYRKNEVKYPRLGVVASKHSVKKAVWRNRIKRVVKEVFRIQKNQLSAFDMVVIAKPPSIKANNKELYKCIKKLFAKLKR